MTLPADAEIAHPLAPDLPGRRVAALDGIRGLAILIVMIGHAGWLAMGAAGVDMFFVLSGYLITGLLLDEHQQTGRVRFYHFYARRFLRLAPALILVVTLYVIASALLHMGFRRAVEDAVLAVGYAANWTLAFGMERPRFLAHTWSLCIEEQYYLLWPVTALAIYRVLGRGKLAAALCVAAAVAVMAYRRWMLGAGGGGEAIFFRVYYGSDTRGDALLLGSAMAFFTLPLRGIVAAAVGWLGLAALLGYLATQGYGRGYSFVIPAACTVAILLSLLNAPRSRLAAVLSLKWLAWLGMISYGVYLFHYPILAYMDYKKWNSWGLTLIGLPLSLALAVASFYLLERPCLRLKDHFRRPATPVSEGASHASRHQVVSAES
jgi:peptidoglycan/LPS O-acetylase OafA/YrhL